jgi:nitrogenase molybdenum-iron protein alpha/beta subunit
MIDDARNHEREEVMSYRPDIIIKNSKDKTFILKDVAILAARISRKR